MMVDSIIMGYETKEGRALGPPIEKIMVIWKIHQIPIKPYHRRQISLGVWGVRPQRIAWYEKNEHLIESFENRLKVGNWYQRGMTYRMHILQHKIQFTISRLKANQSSKRSL